MNFDNAHLSQIETRWSVVFRAHRDEDEAAQGAQRELMERYSGAVLRYLLGVTRDPDIAADLAQEFALRFLRGDFHRADPRRGRFRDFVKSAVHNLVIDAHRRRNARSHPRALPEGTPDPAVPAFDPAELDRQFYDCWRAELMNCAWKGLARLQEQTRQPFHSVLRARADHPALRSADLAERLSTELGRPVNAGWVRQTLLRAREKFVALLVAEVAHSLGDPTAEQVDEELVHLDLWDYCRATRERRGGP